MIFRSLFSLNTTFSYMLDQVILIGEFHDDLQLADRYLFALEKFRPDVVVGEMDATQLTVHDFLFSKGYADTSKERIPYLENCLGGIVSAVERYNNACITHLSYDCIDPGRIDFFEEREQLDPKEFDEEWELLYSRRDPAILNQRELLNNRWDSLGEFHYDPQRALRLAFIDAVAHESDTAIAQYMMVSDVLSRYLQPLGPPPELEVSVMQRDTLMIKNILSLQGTILVGVGRGHIFGKYNNIYEQLKCEVDTTRYTLAELGDQISLPGSSTTNADEYWPNAMRAFDQFLARYGYRAEYKED